MKLRYVKKAELTLDDGLTISMEYLGTGMFCTAWKNGDDVYLITKENSDWSKEIIANIDFTNPHLPKCKWIGDI